MHRSTTPDRLRRPLENLAVWQLLCFLLLICLVWAFELLNLQAKIFGGEEKPVDYVHTCLVTSGILVVALVTVGQTYLQQRRMLNGIVVICSYCHKVRIDEETWQQIEAFVSQHSRADFSHSICPGCHHKALLDSEADTVTTI
jgi:hypothetical protein